MLIETIAKAINEATRISKRRKFVQSIDLIINLRDIDLRKPENRIDEIIELPHPAGRGVKVCVFASGALVSKAREAGADRVIEKDNISRLGADKKVAKKLAKEFDFFVAEGSLMPLVGKHLGSVLGPRGKMPMPVPPTVDIKSIVERLRRSVRIRVRGQPVIQCRIGSEEMDGAKVAENVKAVFSKLEGRLAKGMGNIERAFVKCTMGSPVEIEIKP